MKITGNLEETVKLAFAENKVFCHILSTVVEGGRIMAKGSQVELLLGMLPGVLVYEMFEHLESVKGLRSVDLVIAEELSVDELWQLNHLCSAKVLHYSQTDYDSALYDCVTTEKTLRSAILSLGLVYKQMGNRLPRMDLLHGQREPALLLDRDGVLLKFEDYLKDENAVELFPGIVSLLRRAHEFGFKVGVITNQSGIGRGWITWDQYQKVSRRMHQLLAEQGQWIDFMLEAPYHDTAASTSGMVRPSLRKPRAGMIIEARDRHGLDLSKSIFIGDRASDIMAAALAGVGSAFFLKSEVVEAELTKWRSWPLVSRSSWGMHVPVLETPEDLQFS